MKRSILPKLEAIFDFDDAHDLLAYIIIYAVKNRRLSHVILVFDSYWIFVKVLGTSYHLTWMQNMLGIFAFAINAFTCSSTVYYTVLHSYEMIFCFSSVLCKQINCAFDQNRESLLTLRGLISRLIFTDEFSVQWVQSYKSGILLFNTYIFDINYIQNKMREKEFYPFYSDYIFKEERQELFRIIFTRDK